eukprot:TRINITY_DN5284_c0_g2_i1.p1 TRINITY_DN5284_c0_g2~~TRINITY_DN5284_c0_g2_i1.p1  ORF type:complete len:366 (+),score=73.55 TRINITY_DN5284_c0_g2_i1:381-1478(+)
MSSSSSSEPIVKTSKARVDIKHKYSLTYEVGEGTYGQVYKAEEKGKGNKVAIKKFRPTKEGEGISLTACREISLLKELRHSNIINLQDVCLNAADRSLYLIFEYAEYDLFAIIKHHRDTNTTIPHSTVKSLIWQILNGIYFMHSNWVMHRDLKPSNIMVMGEGSDVGTVKIADFGLARIFQSPLRPLHDNGVVVTIWYRAPELLLGSKHYTKQVDIWAIGCIFAELLTTKPLFPGKEKDPKTPSLFQDDQVDKIFRMLGKPTPTHWPDIVHLPEWKRVANWENYPNVLAKAVGLESEEHALAYDLLNKMVEYDPARRITAESALEHPYFKSHPLPSNNAFQTSSSQMQLIPYPVRQPTKPKRKDT